MRKTAVIIVAAGEGQRFGGPKQFVTVQGRPLLAWTLDKFIQHDQVDDIVLVLPPAHLNHPEFQNFPKIKAIMPGGTTRLASVQAGFKAIERLAPEIVLVHDGVRPCLSRDLISRVIEAAVSYGAVVPIWPIPETVKKVAGKKIVRTVDRKGLFTAQTPQGFQFKLLAETLNWAQEMEKESTDEASLLEQRGLSVYTILGERTNIKVTVPEDLTIAEAFLELENRSRL